MMTAGGSESDPVAVPEIDGDQAGGWLDRIEATIERYPWPALLIALSLGYIMSRRMR
jgi:predicted alpha/beta hydrolase family esterase